MSCDIFDPQVDEGLGGPLADVYKGSEDSYQLDALTPGRNYRCSVMCSHLLDVVILCSRRCRVCAMSEGGQGKWSPVATFETPPTRPHPPTSLRVAGKVTQGSAVVQWGMFTE